MSCPHRNIVGDNYGETCQDCGQTLAGYGYWGESIKECIHRWWKTEDGKREICYFCETEREIRR